MDRLAIDQGNTRTKWALFDGSKAVNSGQLSNLNVPKLEELILEHKAKNVILASTKHLTKRMMHFFNRHPNYYILSHELALPFQINYRTPHTLGRDRIALVAGAWAKFPRQNSLVIDVGTCITYDVIKKNGQFIGGNISPGMNMRLQSMHHFTDRLPLVSLSDTIVEMGHDTESALRVGAQMGTLLEIEGFIKSYKQKLNKLNILLTGGDAHFFVNRLKTRIFAAPLLVLQGLNEILEYNVQKLS